MLACGVEQRLQPAGSDAGVVVDEHDELARRALDAGVARDVQAERTRVRLVARAEALGKLARSLRRSGVVDDEHLDTQGAASGAIDDSATSR